MRNRPPESLRPITTPSTVMSRFAVAVPSSRRVVPLSSARDTDTAADAGTGGQHHRQEHQRDDDEPRDCPASDESR